MAIAKNEIALETLPIGSRLLVRSRSDWRFAAVARITEERIVLTVCSPTGRTYRLRREHGCMVTIEGTIPVLHNYHEDHWRDNFSRYDVRW